MEVWFLAFLLALGWGPLTGQEPPPEPPEEPPVQEAPSRCLAWARLTGSWHLPPSLAQANDLRWIGDEEMAVVSSRHGVAEIRMGERPQVQGWIMAQDGKDALNIPQVVARAGEYLLCGGFLKGPGHGVLWTKPDSTQVAGYDKRFGLLLDLDARGSRVAALAARRGERRQLIRNGSLVWMSQLDPKQRESLRDPRPVFFSADGPSVISYIHCGLMQIGALRFLTDGSLLVVPQFEEGVFLYDTEGKLQRTWSSGQVGFDAGCPMTVEEGNRYALDEPARWRWTAERRVVDDILPLPDGRAAVLVRKVEDDTATWTMQILDPDDAAGEVLSCPLTLPDGQPLASDSHLARLKVDRRGEEVAFLVLMVGAADHPLRTEKPQLITLELE